MMIVFNIIKKDKKGIKPRIDPPRPNPQPEIDLIRLTILQSFISSFEEEKSSNETDIEVLGLDLKCQEPLLPILHSVLSDAPLHDNSRHPTPESYSKIQLRSKNPAEKLSLFSPKLFFSSFIHILMILFRFKGQPN